MKFENRIQKIRIYQAANCWSLASTIQGFQMFASVTIGDEKEVIIQEPQCVGAEVGLRCIKKGLKRKRNSHYCERTTGWTNPVEPRT